MTNDHSRERKWQKLVHQNGNRRAQRTPFIYLVYANRLPVVRDSRFVELVKAFARNDSLRYFYAIPQFSESNLNVSFSLDRILS